MNNVGEGSCRKYIVPTPSIYSATSRHIQLESIERDTEGD